MKGLPTAIFGNTSLYYLTNVTSLEFMPKYNCESGDWCQLPSRLTSLVGIADRITTAGKSLFVETHGIKEGGIGILLIDGIQEIKGVAGRPVSKPFEIISKYLSQPDSIFECQTELIDAGFAEYAIL